MSIYLRQLSLGPMKNFVYLVGPEAGRSALVVDPAWDVDAIERQLLADGKELAGVFVSHHHGDHINGLAELLRRRDVPVYVQEQELGVSAALQGLRGALRPLKATSEIELDGGRFGALWTPGHTPGSQCLLARDALVSGDTLFVDHCGRCDLPGGDPEAMFRSLKSLLALPRTTRLLPGHDYGEVPISSLERESAHNPYLQFQDAAAFVRFRMRR